MTELEPYTVPEQDADLWGCGVVTTEERKRAWPELAYLVALRNFGPGLSTPQVARLVRVSAPTAKYRLERLCGMRLVACDRRSNVVLWSAP